MTEIIHGINSHLHAIIAIAEMEIWNWNNVATDYYAYPNILIIQTNKHLRVHKE